MFHVGYHLFIYLFVVYITIGISDSYSRKAGYFCIAKNVEVAVTYLGIPTRHVHEKDSENPSKGVS